MGTLQRHFFYVSLVFSGVAVGQPAQNPPSYSAEKSILQAGESLFTRLCANCHSLENDGIGPRLGGVTTILPREALHGFIRDPSAVLASGDERAVALRRRYGSVMPSFEQLTPDQTDSILAYIHHQSIERNLSPLQVSADNRNPIRRVPPVKQSGIAIELEDFAVVPPLPGRPAYKGITFMRPDPREEGSYFVNDLMGVLYRLRNRKPSVFLDVREHFPKFVFEPGVATGLGSFALHPEYKKNGIFYTTHSEIAHGSKVINADDIPADVPPHESPPLEWILTEWKQDKVDAKVFSGSRREVLRFITPTTAHGSQEIDFAPVSDPGDPDYAKLYIACGDGGSINLKRPDMAGHPHTLLGSIMRIDPAGTNGTSGQYGIPADNPFAGSEDPRVHREIWAYGFRNPHRFSWDFTYGRRMIGIDIGEANIEEVNLLKAGGSYGWGISALEGNMRIDPISDPTTVTRARAEQLASHISPHGQYDHTEGQAITGGFVHHGPLKFLQDKYIFGDIVNGRLFYMNMATNLDDKTIYEIQVQRNGKPTTIRDLSSVERAHLRLAYDHRTGDLFILTKDDGRIRRVANATMKSH